MKLTRIRLEQLKRFRQPLEIDGLGPGLNLFSGPNEAGKSTIVAAIRAAFFERHRSGSVDALRPWNDPTASPTVEIDFELEGQAHRLRKSFLVRRRCELQAGALRLDGAAAEDHLARLLGFEYAAKGASAAQHWGIPGLLWIEQGTAQELNEPVGHAGDHLRSALDESLGDLASRGGDDVLASVETLRNALLTTQTGAPRGPYADAVKLVAGLEAELAALDQTIGRYREKVDSLASLRAAHAVEEASPPWLADRQHEREASARLEATRALAETLARERRREQQLAATVGLLRDQLGTFANQQEQAVTRRATLAEAQRAHDEAQRRLAEATAAHQDAAPRHAASRETLRLARQQESRVHQHRQRDEQRRKAQATRATLDHAEAEQARLAALRCEAAETWIAPDKLQALREQRERMRELQVELAAAATRLSFRLADGVALEFGGEVLSGHGERWLVEASTLTLRGVGELQIVPGGADLALRSREHQRLADASAALLRDLGLPSLQAAEQRQQTHAQLHGDIRTRVATLHALAPRGLAALRAECEDAEARRAQLDAALAQLPHLPDPPDPPDPPDGADALPGVAQAEAEEEASRASLDHVDRRLDAARQNAAGAQAAYRGAQREVDTLEALLNQPERTERLAQARRALVDAQAEQSTLAAAIAEMKARLDAAGPDTLAQDVERFRARAALREQQFLVRRDALLRLDAELQAAGAQGLDERRAELARDHAQAQRRLAELQRRARALDHLLTLLRTRRQALTRRLQAPLQRHLNRYLGLLFPPPGTSVEIDANLRPGPLKRGAGDGMESATFESLSFGSREQMGVIARLAYADLLQAAGRPTLIILDDALVHSDDARRERMKRVLGDAATRHQILLFTCHPQNWNGLGVAARVLETAAGETLLR